MRGRNILQSVLAGLSGGLEGQAAQRSREDELRRLEEQTLYQRQRDSAASERQAMLDAVALAEKGYVEQGERAETVKRAAPALQAALSNAGSILTRSGAPMQDSNTAALRAAAGQFGAPVSSVKVGGKTMELAQTPLQRAAMVAEQERGADRFAAQQDREAATRQKQGDVQEQARRIKQALGDQVTDAQALAMASGMGADYFVTKKMDEGEKARLGMDRERLGIERERLKMQRDEKGQAAPVKLSVSAQGKLSGYQSGLLMTADIRDQLSVNKNATGIKGMLWGPALDRLDPEGVGLRSALEALSGEIRNQRFGGALTASEAKFAERFLPSDRDRYDAVVKKLDNLEKYLNQKAEGLFKAAEFGKTGWEPSQEERVEPRKPNETVAQYRARTQGR